MGRKIDILDWLLLHLYVTVPYPLESFGIFPLDGRSASCFLREKCYQETYVCYVKSYIYCYKMLHVTFIVELSEMMVAHRWILETHSSKVKVKKSNRHNV